MRPPASIDLSHARGAAEQAALSVAPFLREGFGRPSAGVHEPGQGGNAADATTTFDRDAEARIADRLQRFDASLGFWGEELGRSGSATSYWLVDALSGTGHFLRGTLFASTMISLVHQDAVVATVVHDFVNDRMFSASRGQGTTCNGEQVRVSGRSLGDAYLAAEVRLDGFDNHWVLERLQSVVPVLSMANYGWELSMTADGTIDGFVAKDCWGGPWDLAPGALLIPEAGGVATTFDGDPYDVRRQDLVSGSPEVHGALMDLLHRR